MTPKGNLIRLGAMLAGILLAVSLVLVVQPVDATGNHLLIVDGVSYQPDKETGGAVHYFTPGTSPTTASTERHQWLGNGSEHLPCSGRLHWIDNVNLLTISHCEEGETTTTTTTATTIPPSSTTSTTSTTVPRPSTTTTTDPTTTTVPESTSTTQAPPSSTTVPPDGSTTTEPPPVGGVPTGGGALAALVCGCPSSTAAIFWLLAGAALVALSALTLYRVRLGGKT